MSYDFVDYVFLDGFDEHVDVNAAVRRNRYYGGVFRHRSLDERLDFFVVGDGLFLRHYVDFVLDYDYVFDSDNGKSHEMLFGLGLGAAFVRRHQEECAVH